MVLFEIECRSGEIFPMEFDEDTLVETMKERIAPVVKTLPKEITLLHRGKQRPTFI